MIANQRQYRQAQAQLEEFRTARELTEARGPSDGVDPRVHAMMGAAFGSEAEALREQIKRYEKLVAGQVRQIKSDSLVDIGLALIEARIASGMTQKTLAQALGLAEQQIQRYEANEYTGASLDRLQEVADALGVQASLRFHVQPGARGVIADAAASGTAGRSTGDKTRGAGKSKARRTTASRAAVNRTTASARSQGKSGRTSNSSSKAARKSTAHNRDKQVP